MTGAQGQAECRAGAGRLVAVGEAGRLLSSADGAHWVASEGWVGSFASVAWNGTAFLAWGTIFPSYALILTSPDGIHWSGGSPPIQHQMYSLLWTGSEWLGVGDNGAMPQ